MQDNLEYRGSACNADNLLASVAAALALASQFQIAARLDLQET